MALRLTYKDNQFHHKNLQVLVTEIFNIKKDLVPDIMKDAFESKEPPYNLRSESNQFTHRNVKTTSYGLLSIKHLAPLIRKLVPQSVSKCRTLK